MPPLRASAAAGPARRPPTPRSRAPPPPPTQPPRRKDKGPWKAKRPPPDARTAAVEQLVRIEDGAYIGLLDRADGAAVDEEADANSLAVDAAARRRTTELVAGTTRWRRRLDFIGSTLAGRSMAEVDPAVRQILRLGLYELTDLDTPPHALSAHVDLARAAANEGAAGLVNAVLRRAADLKAAGDLPDPVPDAASASSPSAAARARLRALAVSTSHPDWMVKRWLGRFGEADTAALLAWNNARPAHCLRVVGGGGGGGGAAELAALLAEGGATTEPASYLPSDFVRVTAGLGTALAPGGPVATGRAQVQDEAAGLVVAAALDPRPGERVLDVAAAPGGKALYAAARMGGQGTLVARDVSAARLKPLARAAASQGLRVGSFLVIEAGDGRAGPPPFALDSPASLFDRVLLDAPCSGTGVLAKRADLRWQRTADDLAGLAGLQDALLDGAAGWVAPGGLLVYSTCSLEPEENAERVDAFLSRPAGADFEVEPIPLASLGLPHGLTSADGRFLEVLPHRHGVDGAFAARLRRRKGVL